MQPVFIYTHFKLQHYILRRVIFLKYYVFLHSKVVIKYLLA